MGPKAIYAGKAGINGTPTGAVAQTGPKAIYAGKAQIIYAGKAQINGTPTRAAAQTGSKAIYAGKAQIIYAGKAQITVCQPELLLKWAQSNLCRQGRDKWYVNQS